MGDLTNAIFEHGDKDLIEHLHEAISLQILDDVKNGEFGFDDDQVIGVVATCWRKPKHETIIGKWVDLNPDYSEDERKIIHRFMSDLTSCVERFDKIACDFDEV